jgi:hypothetical protein
MTTPTLTITDRVSAGAAWLDEHRPDWWQRIDLDTLDLREPCYCVLGQEYAAEVDLDGHGLCCNGYQLAVARMDDHHPAELGFSADLHLAESVEFWDQLADAWRELILARRAGTETTR